MTEPLFPSTSASQTPNPPFRTTKNSGSRKSQKQISRLRSCMLCQKNPKNSASTHSVLRQGRAWGGGGGAVLELLLVSGRNWGGRTSTESDIGCGWALLNNGCNRAMYC